MPRSYENDHEDKPCRACSEFSGWVDDQKKGSHKASKKRKDCPLDKSELGHSTWGFLHTMASYYPSKPSKLQVTNMVTFLNIFAQFYPCEPCALDFQEDMKTNPPTVANRDEFAKWLCDRHNTVNAKLGKPSFDCTKVHERWKDGWPDGSCN